MNKTEKIAAAQDRLEMRTTEEIKSIRNQLVKLGVIANQTEVPMVYVGIQITDYMLASFSEGGLEVLLEEERDSYADMRDAIKKATEEYKWLYTPIFKTRLYHEDISGVKFALAAFPIGPIADEGN